MLDRTGREASRRHGANRPKGRRGLAFEPLEVRSMMAASIAAIAPITSPAGLGYQLPLDGSASAADSQTYSVTSSNPDIKATVAKGEYLTINVTHASSGTGDPAFSGALTFQLFDDLTPLTTSRIEQLVNSGFYTNKNFHRITTGVADDNGYIAQGGSVNGAGLDSPPAPGQPGGLPTTGFPFNDEFSQQLAFTGSGQLAMANAGDNTNTSQFFLTSNTARGLDFGYNLFGQLVSGQATQVEIDNVAKQTSTTTGSPPSTPVTPVLITSATLSTVNPNGVVHVDTTGATQGETGTLTITATDPATNTTATQTASVTVGSATNPDTSNPEKPFLVSYPTAVTVGLNQVALFKVTGISPGNPTDKLTYTATVVNAIDPSTNQPSLTANATASVDANGIVSVVPNSGYTGPIYLNVGVADATTTTPDVHPITITVNASAAAVNLTPITLPFTQAVNSGTATTVTLNGNTANPASSQTLDYALLTQPTHGTLTNFNATAGTVTYTPTAGYTGTDTFTYDATDAGAPTPNLTSPATTVTLNVAAPSEATGSVREIGNILVVTPPPQFNKARNTVSIDQVTNSATVGAIVQVTVDGVLDSTQPVASTLGGIVVYGGNTGNTIAVSQNVTVPTTLDAGHGGENFVQGGGTDSRIHAWFGRDVVQGGTGANAIIGRLKDVRVVKSPGTDSVFLSGLQPYHRLRHYRAASFHGTVPSVGHYYKFVGTKLVKTSQPATTRLDQTTT